MYYIKILKMYTDNSHNTIKHFMTLKNVNEFTFYKRRKNNKKENWQNALLC